MNTPSPTQPTQPAIQQPPRPIFISGKVVMSDGLPVPPNTSIQRVCSGTPHTVAYTDSKGRFNFQWGQTAGILMDASESNSGYRSPGSNPSFGGAQSGLGGAGSDPFNSRITNCELQAYLPGFRSDLINLYNMNSLDNPDVGTIVLHRIANVEGTSVSATSLQAPKDARKAYEHGLQMLLKNKPVDAEKDFEKAVASYPKYADAWASLGKIRQQNKANDNAREAYLKASEADPKLVIPYLQLGMMSADKANWEEAAQYLERATKLDPVDYPQAWYVSAVANFNLKKFDAAEKGAREAMKLDPKHRNPRADYLLGLVLAEKHDYTGAAAQLKSYLELAPDAQDQQLVRKQLTQLQGIVSDSEGPK